MYIYKKEKHSFLKYFALIFFLLILHNITEVIHATQQQQQPIKFKETGTYVQNQVDGYILKNV